MSRFSLAVPWCLLLLVPLSSAQGPGLSFPNSAVNVLNYGAQADAQTSDGSSCSITSGTNTLNCSPKGIFTTADVGKSIEVPGAGATGTSPAPNATLLTTITAVVASSVDSTTNIGKFKSVTVAANATNTATGVPVVWGTDNSGPLQSAVNACPSPSNASVISPFGSKGCVIVVPNSGSAGTGDYMFGSSTSGIAVNAANLTSFQIIGMGNSSIWQNSTQAGVRLLTAMPITILSVGQNGQSNGGSFQLENISFVDTSQNGSAIGGLLMNGVSEALIAYAEFENFNGQQADFAPGTTALSYGMKATAYGGGTGLFNNNIILLHVKGKNNSIFYDASQGKQDGPILIGGDILPNNLVNSKPANPPWSGYAGCFGIMSSGGIRLYGTHFDVNTDFSGNPCIGILTLSAGVISGKFESAGGNGTGVVLGGGSTTSASLGATSCSKSSNAVTCTATNSLSPGQVITVSGHTGADATNFDGNFVVTSATSSQFTYDYPGANATSSTTGTVSPKVSTSVKVEGIFNNLTSDVIINTGASNNTVFDMSASGAHVTDNGASDVVQKSDANVGTNSVNLGPKTGTVDAFAISDAAGNSGTGHLVSVITSSGSAAKPVEFASNGNGVEMSTAGVLSSIGSGHINAGILIFFCNGTFSNSATNILTPGANSTGCSATSAGGIAELPVPFAGTLKNLFVNVNTTGSTTTSGVVTANRLGSPTSITCTIGNAATACHDVTHTQAVSAGDTISIRVGTGASETLKQMSVSLELQ